MQEVLNKVKPSSKEKAELKTITTKFITTLQKNLGKDAKVVLGGSGARDTWLAGNHDVDIFVMFNYRKYSSQSSKLSEILVDKLKKSFPKQKISRVHGSRDYFQTTYGELNLEIIPILAISNSEQALNITDVSTLHTKWVNKHTKKLKDDVRLAKQFLRANDLYGAESFICGFSGYVTEILVAHYGSFKNFLEAVGAWGKKTVIDPSKFYPRGDALFNLNKSKTISPIVIVDPVDKNRNAAAALSRKKFLEIKKVARKYLKKPNLSFFVKEEITFSRLNKGGQNVVFITVSPLKGKIDVVGVKLLKVFNFLQVKLNNFDIKKSGWDWNRGDKAIFFFVMGRNELPIEEVRKGPPLSLKEHVKMFKKKNKKTYTKSGFIMAKVKVENPKIADNIKVLLNNPYVKERIKKVREIKLS